MDNFSAGLAIVLKTPLNSACISGGVSRHDQSSSGPFQSAAVQPKHCRPKYCGAKHCRPGHRGAQEAGRQGRRFPILRTSRIAGHGPSRSGDAGTTVHGGYSEQGGVAARVPRNWRRGCFRLWIVGSALFIIAVAAVTSIELQPHLEGLDRSGHYPTYIWMMLLNGIGIAVGGPLLVLTIGAAIGWAFSGFQAPPAPNRRLISLAA